MSSAGTIVERWARTARRWEAGPAATATRMRILQYFSRLRACDGGPPTSALDLCAALADAGHEVVLLTAGGDTTPTAWLDPPVEGRPTIRLLTAAGRALSRVAGRLAGPDRAVVEAELERADAVHLHVPWDPITLAIGRLAVRAGKGYVLTPHGMLDTSTRRHHGLRKSLFLAAGGRRCLREAAVIHCTSTEELQQSRGQFVGGRGTVLPLLIRLPDHGDTPPTAGETVLFLGRLHPIKCVPVLLEAMALLRRRRPDTTLVIAGSGDDDVERSLHEQARRLGLGDSCLFTGHVAGEEKVRRLRQARLLALPSSHENWGVVLIEALASGTPVVTTDGVGIWRELEASGGAVIADRTPEAFADAMEAILADPDRRRDMADRGRAWVERELVPERLIPRYEDLYRSIAAGVPVGDAA